MTSGAKYGQPTGRELNLYALLMLPWNRPAYLLSARMGIHPTRMSEYARGKRPIPDRVLIRMCEVLNVDAAEILRPFDIETVNVVRAGRSKVPQ